MTEENSFLQISDFRLVTTVHTGVEPQKQAKLDLHGMRLSVATQAREVIKARPHLLSAPNPHQAQRSRRIRTSFQHYPFPMPS